MKILRKELVMESVLNKRIGYVDFLRGVMIIIMVMGHIGFSSYFDKYIHAFHMPIWFFISGWFFKDNGEKIFLFLKKRVKTMLLPYLFWGMIQYPCWLFWAWDGQSNMVEPIINLFWVNTNLVMPIAGALWFLTALFFAEFIFFLL